MMKIEEFANKLLARVRPPNTPKTIDKLGVPERQLWLQIAEHAMALAGGKGATRPRKTSPHQNVGTPPDFLAAVQARFGPIGFDLAADDDLHVAERYYTPAVDSLNPDIPWPSLTTAEGYCWLNPPYKKIGPWVQRCAEESQKHPACRILCLVPASVDAVWFRRWVKPFAKPHFVSPRVTFLGHKDPYPKPMMLLRYDKYLTPYEGLEMTDFVWKQKEEKKKK